MGVKNGKDHGEMDLRNKECAWGRGIKRKIGEMEGRTHGDGSENGGSQKARMGGGITN